MKKLKIALDVDDVLLGCVQLACERLGMNPALFTEYDISRTNYSEQEKAAFLKEMANPEFYKLQTPLPGAQRLVKELLDEGHEVIIASAINQRAMNERAEMLHSFFPEIVPRNIMLGARKDLLCVDFLLDDNPSNLNGAVKYPILFSQPHNKNATGFIRANSYDEFLEIVRATANAVHDALPSVLKPGEPGIICLVGPSGSGKSFISDELCKNPKFKKLKACTDRPKRENEIPGAEYDFCTAEEFASIQKDLLESTRYNGYHYGISDDAIHQIWDEGKVAIKPVDITGAKAIKAKYPEKALVLYVNRSKDRMINAIIDRPVSSEEKTRRIMSLDQESLNREFCDFTIDNNETLDHAVQQVMRLI